MSTNHEKFAAVRVWLDRGLNAAALDPDDPRAEALAAYLFSDIQANEHIAIDILTWLDDVVTGKTESDDITGNSSTVTIGREDVLIENNYLENLNSFRYTHDEFRTAMQQVVTVMLDAERGSVSDQD